MSKVENGLVLIISPETIEKKILIIRGRKIMLDFDLAPLYEVEVKQLKRAVRRNLMRFPSDFMFELKSEEYTSLRCQFGTLEKGKHTKYLPFAFTEQGVAMLSSVLNSERAIQVNIQIMRTFTKLRELLSTHKDLKRKLEEMEKKYDSQFRIVFDAIKSLLESPEIAKEPIGFRSTNIKVNHPKGK